mgnify:CR=1 FL=1
MFYEEFFIFWHFAQYIKLKIKLILDENSSDVLTCNLAVDSILLEAILMSRKSGQTGLNFLKFEIKILLLCEDSCRISRESGLRSKVNEREKIFELGK